jgi:hypothetical protein
LPGLTRLDPGLDRARAPPLAVPTWGTLNADGSASGPFAVSPVIFSLPAVSGVDQITASTALVVRVPRDRRGQAVCIANAGVAAGQGAAFLAGGAAAQMAAPAVVIGGKRQS